ncbi:molybdopterin-dependent oxidoreductase [Kribbella sp. CA-253562]|uniref:molybdopterin-dependent oxidoreductase n=1 Tax=Kribbella sp. CA-253562 TaxID=3239942 RepID=UPI003D907E84
MKNLGTADKPILVGGVLAAVAVFALVAGVVGVKRPRVALGMTVVLGVLAIVAAATGRSLAVNPVVRVLPGFVTLLAATVGMYLVLRTRGYSLRGRPEDKQPAEAEKPDGFDRRKFLVTTFALGAAGVGGVVASRVLPGGVDDATRRAIKLPAPASRARVLPAGVAADVAGVSPFTTSNKSFYRVDTLLTVPKVDPRNWELRVHGMVDRELRLNFADLLGRRLVERDITLTCVSNEVGGPYVGNARWIGVPIAEILREAGVQAGADAVKSTSVDGLTIGTPLAALTDGRDAIFAVGMNGEPLPFDHGFPVRMVVPGLYGYVSATKWIVDFEVTRFEDFSAYWTDRGWAVEAPIKTASRIDVPKGFARIKPGPAVAAGVAWAQHRGIAKVEVQVDDGPWQEAKLADEAGIDIWRQWTFRWDATSGNHTLTVRATDRTGQVQTADRAAPRPNGSSGLHNTVVMVE